MHDHERVTRVTKYEKRRKNNKYISILLMVAGILFIFLIGTWIFGGEESAKESQEIGQRENNDEDINQEATDNQESSGTDNKLAAIDEGENENQQLDENEVVETEPLPIDDENVLDAYTGNWQPIGTVQENPETTNYDEGSENRLEIEHASRVATNLQEGNIIPWWIENGGNPEKVIATVSSKDETEIYRVYMTWMDGQGWQPDKVEKLRENDQKWRFE